MGKEMIGVDYQVAEVDSSFNGDRVEIVDPNLTFEEAANNFARRHCVPGKEILRKEKKLADDPIKAAQKVKIEGAPKDSDILIEASARVKIASDYLDQTPKQEEHFKGIRDNFSGLSGWFEGRGKIVKNIATAGLVAQMALTACNVKLPTPHPSETTPTEPPIVETTEAVIPGFILKTETPSPVVATPSGESPFATATETQPAPAIEVAPYPSSIDEFKNGPEVLTGDDAEERIKALGGGDDLRALKDWYVASGISTSVLEVVIGESETGAHWNILIKYPSGNYGVITLTSGSEVGKIVRDGGLVSYLYSEDRPTFSYKELTNPVGYEGVFQKPVMSESLWFATALEKDNQLLGWANLDIKQNEEWVDLQAPTPIKEAASEVWQLSPDGHIYYNESELYGGLFTINTENPEYVEAYWEDTIRGLWGLNSVSKNTAFLNQFPTEDSLIEYIKDGGGPVNNLWIPVIYPETERQYLYQATMKPVEGSVDLSTIALSIYKPTREEIYAYSPSPERTNYISYMGGANEVYVETIEKDGKQILSFSYRSDILIDDTMTTINGKIGRLCLDEKKTGEDNLKAALQLIRSWNLRIFLLTENKVVSDGIFYSGVESWLDSKTYGPEYILNLQSPSVWPTPKDYEEIATLDNSPLSVR